ncbi:MAG: helix-turn-helix transcriptional regulator [Syntrophobacterales bacterium]|nr:helix-turn-helix transcriptional regulator [Syntrophobacterales bacterium]
MAPTKLKIMLVMREISQEDLARRTGIPKNTISRIVNGDIPKLVYAQKIAHALGTTVDELWPLSQEDEPEPF